MEYKRENIWIIIVFSIFLFSLIFFFYPLILFYFSIWSFLKGLKLKKYNIYKD